jgi:hypothetical protein
MRDRDDDLVIVHVKADSTPCHACHSSNVLTISVAARDSPIWVRVCSDCDERTWSLDTEVIDVRD